MKAFNIDYETIGSPLDQPGPILLSVAVCVFDIQARAIPDYGELMKSSMEVKFDIRSQKEAGRVANADTKKWWLNQSEEAKEVLRPSSDDLTLLEGHRKILDFLEARGIQKKKSLAFCRGQSFDFPLFEQALAECDLECPYMFWNQNDVRSILKGMYADPYARKFLLPKGWLPENFVKHNARADVVKDAGLLIHGQLLSEGTLPFTREDDYILV